jgi:hypothetical protein
MKKLTKPTYLPKDVFTTCISKVADPDLKTRFDEIIPEIVLAATFYDYFAKNVCLHLFPVKNKVGRVEVVDLIKVYSDRMVGSKSPGRPIYDAIKMAPDRGVCPICNTLPIKQLDHYLPKAIYPILSVLPTNLIPICKDCNDIKNQNRPNTQEELTFHPYYDDFDTERWLGAVVVETTPPAVKFEVRPPDTWGEVKSARAVNHFNSFELGTLFTTLAGSEIRGMQRRLTNLFAVGGADAVRVHLNIEFESKNEADSNSWQTATYEALRDNLWFCSGGFVIE